jgi:hypothetical protein
MWRQSDVNRHVDYWPWIFWISPASSKSFFVRPPALCVDKSIEPECLLEILEFEHTVQISLHHAPAIELPQSRCNFLF